MGLKQKFDEKGVVFGFFMKLPDPAIVEIAGLSGFDYVIIDCEHGPLDMLTAENMIRAAKLNNLSSVIRVSDNNAVLISRALDIGADAVQIPQINKKSDAKEAVSAAKFYPKGERGVCRYVRAAGYSSIDKGRYFQKANRETEVIIHIEGEEGVKNFNDILEVAGIDVVFLGPYDLSQSLGLTGQVDHPKVIARMQEMIDKARQKGKMVGTFVDDFESAKRWIDRGVQYIAYSVDTGMIYQSFKEIVTELSSLRGEKHVK